jgi:hypothetical protein
MEGGGGAPSFTADDVLALPTLAGVTNSAVVLKIEATAWSSKNRRTWMGRAVANMRAERITSED